MELHELLGHDPVVNNLLVLLSHQDIANLITCCKAIRKHLNSFMLKKPPEALTNEAGLHFFSLLPKVESKRIAAVIRLNTRTEEELRLLNVEGQKKIAFNQAFQGALSQINFSYETFRINWMHFSYFIEKKRPQAVFHHREIIRAV